jgi:hypothetical protein
LTASLVIIGAILVGIIQRGLEDTSGAIEDTLVAAATSLRGGGDTGGDTIPTVPDEPGTAMTFDDYLATAGSLPAAFSAAAEETPDGYYFDGKVDADTRIPIYTDFDSGSSTQETYSVNGEIYLASEYPGTIVTYGPY